MADITKWNAIAVEYADWLENQKDKKGFAFNQALTNAIIKRLPANENFTLLDLGCGDGSLLNLLNSRYTKFFGVDGAEKMIDVARKKHPHLEGSLSVNDITKQLPFDNNSFDIIICNMVLMDLSDILKTIKEIYRTLKHKGIFIFTIVHPCFNFMGRFFENQNDRYIDNFKYEKILDTNFNSIIFHYHRPIQYYFEQLIQSNLTIKGVEEISIDKSEHEQFKKYYLTANALLIESHKLC